MTLQQIPSEDRYRNKEGWLDTRHHFSFADYYDPKNMHFGPMRVFNDDLIDDDDQARNSEADAVVLEADPDGAEIILIDLP